MAVSTLSRSVGRYRLRKKLFRDDTGTVYLARHAELDREARSRVLEYLQGSGIQVFISALEPGDLGTLSFDHKMFHVEHGRLSG